LGRFFDRLNYFFGVVAGVCFFIIMLIMSADVVGRYLFNKPLIVAQDLSLLLMLAGVFLGAGYVVLIKGFPTVDILYSRLSPSRQRFLDILGCVAGLVFLSIMFWMSLEMGIDAIARRTLATTITMWPLYIYYLVGGVGVLLFGAQITRELVRLLKDWPRDTK
jgi:TRAP-type C4-dicarboxylate transport system permease small subunit